MNPKNRNSSEVSPYWMPMILWSVEKTYFDRNPCSWVSCAAEPAWAGPTPEWVRAVCMECQCNGFETIGTRVPLDGGNASDPTLGKSISGLVCP